MSTDGAEKARLQEIADLQLAQPVDDAVLGEIVREAAREVGCPMALVSIVLDGAQHFIATHGVGDWLAEARGSPVEWAFCAIPVRNKRPFVVSDSRQNELLQGNPLVSQDHLLAYAGIPLITSKGHALGTLCVLNTQTHDFSPRDVQALQALAERVLRQLETRRIVT